MQSSHRYPEDSDDGRGFFENEVRSLRRDWQDYARSPGAGTKALKSPSSPKSAFLANQPMKSIPEVRVDQPPKQSAKAEAQKGSRRRATTLSSLQLPIGNVRSRSRSPGKDILPGATRIRRAHSLNIHTFSSPKNVFVHPEFRQDGAGIYQRYSCKTVREVLRVPSRSAIPTPKSSEQCLSTSFNSSISTVTSNSATDSPLVVDAHEEAMQNHFLRQVSGDCTDSDEDEASPFRTVCSSGESSDDGDGEAETEETDTFDYVHDLGGASIGSTAVSHRQLSLPSLFMTQSQKIQVESLWRTNINRFVSERKRINSECQLRYKAGSRHSTPEKARGFRSSPKI